MHTWKLTIKPDNEEGYNPFELCKKKFLLGVGWSGAYKEKTAKNIDEAKSLVQAEYKKWPYPIKYLIEDIKEGDHIWIHQNGHYYLCKAKKRVIYGDKIHKDFLKYDLGHARESHWINVPELFVSGAVQRGTIAQRMIQKIWLTEKEIIYHEKLFDKLTENPNWKPAIDNSVLSKLIRGIGHNELFSIMSPDDVEDIVSAYLQSNGWALIKSTCFRSKPIFEFSMQNKKNKTSYVQVKSGKNPDPLAPESYRKYTTKFSHIFLFSTNQNPYPGENVIGVTPIRHDVIVNWAIKNLWALTYPLKIRLWIFLGENRG